MSKSSRRKKQDRAKAQAKRAEELRLRARTERARQASEQITRLFDPATPPAVVAEIVAAAFPDTLSAGGMLQVRLNSGVPAEDVAETARLMLARNGTEHQDDTETGKETPTGTIAVAALAAHLAGDEDAEHEHVRELLGRADAEMAATGDAMMRLEVIDSLAQREHGGEACELIEPYLREHPSDDFAYVTYAKALAQANRKNDPGLQERAALARFRDRTDLDVLRAAVASFLDRSGDDACSHAGRNWTEHVRREMDKLRTEYGKKEYWSAAERDTFEAFALELVLAFPYGDKVDAQTAEGTPAPTTPLQAFAADPGTPAGLAARAMAWDDYAHYGMWQVTDPVPSPGVWCTELVSGAEKYVHFPPEVMDAAAPWAVWLGPLVPVDGVWRSTGSGFWLSPVEADALAEYVADLIRMIALTESGVPDDHVPYPQQARFGQAEPHGVYVATDDPLDPDSANLAGMVVASALLQLASWVWQKRSGRMESANTEGQPLVMIDATVAVRGDLPGRLAALPDFGEEEDGEDGQIVWWGDPVDDLTFLPDSERERLVRGRLRPEEGRILVRVNSQERLSRLLKILEALGAEPEVTEERRLEPSVDFAWGPVPDATGRPALEWEKAWVDQQVAVLGAGTPRRAMAVGDEADTARVESMVRQLEYQAGLAMARGEQPLDCAWLRDELGLEAY